MSMVLEETMPGLEPERLAFLSGPTFAREVAQGLPTDVVVASKGMVAARKVQDLVHSVALRTYTSADPVGVQAGGAVQHVIAAAAYDLARKVGVDMPVTEQVYHVLHRGRPLLEAVRQLLERGYKEELQGIRGSAG